MNEHKDAPRKALSNDLKHRPTNDQTATRKEWLHLIQGVALRELAAHLFSSLFQ